MDHRLPVGTGGPVVWICVDDLYPTLQRVADRGGTVLGRPQLDGGERWLVEVDDPAGNRIGLVAPVRRAPPQTMIAVRDVEASSRWYQHLLGLRSDHGGPEYERLLAGGALVLQLHHNAVEHHHGRDRRPRRSGAATASCCGSARSPTSTTPSRGPASWAPRSCARRTATRPRARARPSHREIWLRDPDGYTVVIASPDGEAFAPA